MARTVHKRRLAALRRSKRSHPAGSRSHNRAAGHVRLYHRQRRQRETAAGAGLAHCRFSRRNYEWIERGRASRGRWSIPLDTRIQSHHQRGATMTALFIRRPVMTALVMIGILFFGAVSYTRLAVSDLPTVDFPTIQVNANLPGASPETMAAAVATPLEKQLSTIAGIDNMTSSSGLGSTSITIQFSLDRSIDAAAQDVQAAISQTLRSLPLGILPPSYRKVNPE